MLLGLVWIGLFETLHLLAGFSGVEPARPLSLTQLRRLSVVARQTMIDQRYFVTCLVAPEARMRRVDEGEREGLVL